MAANKRVVDGFTVVPLKYSERSKGCHCLYLREHSVRESHPCKPQGRTVMVLNVPAWCTEECFKRIFSRCGNVENVMFHEKPTTGPPNWTSKNSTTTTEITGFKVAYVVFRSPKGQTRALDLPFDTELVASTKEHPVLTGYRKMCADFKVQHSFNGAEYQKKVEAFMKDFDSKKEEEEEEEKEEEGEPDEDGFITVTRKGKKKGTPFTENLQDKMKEKMRKKRKKKELNLYSHQLRETTLNQLHVISQKHAEDKKRIQKLKEGRKFRPY